MNRNDSIDMAPPGQPTELPAELPVLSTEPATTEIRAQLAILDQTVASLDHTIGILANVGALEATLNGRDLAGFQVCLSRCTAALGGWLGKLAADAILP